MLAESHDLFHEFPEHKEKLEALLENDQEFIALAKKYHALDNEVRDQETRGVNITDEHMKELKTDRAHLKDQIYNRYLA